ncbi:hypothetical protein ACX0MV_20145 [Pseudomonas borbori]
MTKGIILLALSVLAFLASWYCLLWVFSSSSLAAIECNAQFSFFHENLRCRWAAFASVLWILTGITSISLLYFSVKAFKQSNNKAGA